MFHGPLEFSVIPPPIRRRLQKFPRSRRRTSQGDDCCRSFNRSWTWKSNQRSHTL